MKILITGGHLTPALSFIEYLSEEQLPVEIVFVGREFSQATQQQPSRERVETEKRGARFMALESGKSQFHHFSDFWKQPLLLMMGVAHSLRILRQEKPDLVLTFGSYIGVPISFAATLLRIPVVLHEQTHVMGLASRTIAHFAAFVALSRDIVNYQIASKKSIVTGNLLRRIFFLETPAQPEWLDYDSTIPILYITGGSQGSLFLNETVAATLEKLTEKWIIIHQCGTASSMYDPSAQMHKATLGLGPLFKNRYFVREWVTDQELAWILSKARLALARSGANTVDELSLFKVPAIFIPLPKSHFGEQIKNAEEAADEKEGMVLFQSNATPEKVLIALSELTQSFLKVESTTEERKMHEAYHAPSRLWEVIKQVLPQTASA